ncbi:MAG: branched-chain amino acid ABC transporter permease [Actinobacteria bacterium]|nr:branched-chain amino acid ABC transporter permease [Actinomycetota bacterium]MCI0678688.1 branched-chain amino acid ABC transporter permease [Actinomycetota bacterium]
MRGRPLLHTAYVSDQALLNTMTKKVVVGLFVVILALIPFGVVPGIGFLADADWLRLLATVCIFAIGGLGLNILTGLAGQISLGHAFFMGLGAYTAAWLGSSPGAVVGLGLPIWIWLPAAGIVAALVGVAVGPTAVRVRGLYLAFVTLGLVFVGEYLFRRLVTVTGGSQSGRTFPSFEVRLWKEEEPLISFVADGPWFGFDLTAEAKTFYFLLVLTVLFVVLAKNLQRTRVGRAFQSIRDRDIAAEIMGVEEGRYKLIAFGISSFYAGVAGALFASFVGRMIPEVWSLFLSVQFIAIVLIGGAGVVSGTLLGAAFVTILPRLVRDFTAWLSDYVQTGEGLFVWLADIFISTGVGDWGLVNTQAGVAPGLSVAQLNQVLYGLLIIAFLIFEPLGLYGIWLRIRNYWKGWPFTY